MVGDMDHTGPFHADISFPGIVTVSWNNKVLGTTVILGTSTASYVAFFLIILRKLACLHLVAAFS